MSAIPYMGGCPYEVNGGQNEAIVFIICTVSLEHLLSSVQPTHYLMHVSYFACPLLIQCKDLIFLFSIHIQENIYSTCIPCIKIFSKIIAKKDITCEINCMNHDIVQN